MRRPRKRRRNCGTGVLLAVAAFLAALMCISFFSLKVLLFTVAAVLIISGIFLMKCGRERSVHMKIVVLKSPKFFAGILRAVFGIKKMPAE